MELGWDEVGKQIKYIGHQLKCLSENPTNWPIQACQFHFGSFRSFCSLASKTNTGHPHIWQQRRSLFRALPGNQSQGSDAQPNIRGPVINPCQIFHSKGTERYIIWISFCPMKEGMNHERLCHIHDVLNSSFSASILILGHQHWRRLTLSFLLTAAPKLLSREDTIVTMIVFDFTDTLVIKLLFEWSLTHDQFICI